MELAILALTILNLLFIVSISASIYLGYNRFLRQQEDLKKKVLEYSEVQKQNTETLISLLNKTFAVQTDKPAPNDVSQEDQNDLELNEDNLQGLPEDIKLQVEGGDSSAPPGYNNKT